MKAIQIKNLYKQFNDTLAVNGINLEVEEGKIFGLLGPNGAGKSTTINLLSGILELDKGEVKVFDQIVSSKNTGVKKLLGIVPQDIAVFEELSAYDNVKFFGQLYGLNKRELEEHVLRALKFVGLEERKKDVVKHFSGGMKRRVNIACGIVHAPKLIIMDEPTVGIDPQSRNYILKSIQKLNEAGATILYTTHYIYEAELLCDEIAVVDEGKVIAQGDVEQLKSMISDYTRLQIEVGNVLAIPDVALKQIKGVEDIQIKGQMLEVKLKKEINGMNKVLEVLSKADTQVIGIVTKTPNLEDVFLHLTGRELRD